MTEATIDSAPLSPMMIQWQTCKNQAKDAVLLFRMGDFYEAFYDDAIVIAKALELTLTKRQEIPMCGVPHHTSENYIDRLVSKGFRVAIAEQMEDPKQAKGLVKRELVRIVTPGTLIGSTLLPDKSNNYIAALSQVGSFFGLAYLDLSTAEFRTSEFECERELLNDLYRLRPSEIVTSYKFHEKQAELFKEIKLSCQSLITPLEDWRFDHEVATDILLTHFQVHTLDGFGLRGMIVAINTSGALLAYLKDTLCLSIAHIDTLETYSTAKYMQLDKMTQRNLELTESMHDLSRRNTLLDVLDKTKTPMGGRLLRRWIKQPLLDITSIIDRQNSIEELLIHSHALAQLEKLLDEIRDIERLMIKINTGYASPRDLVALKTSLEATPEIQKVLSIFSSNMMRKLCEGITPLPQLTNLISTAIVDEPPLKSTEGKIFRDGYHPELDELRALSQDSKTWLSNYQNQLREETGIKTIKVGFTRMFGYYIEVSKGQTERMPEHFQRRQTLVNGERYITPVLKEYESKVLTAEDRMIAIETELFQQMRQSVSQYGKIVAAMAQQIAVLDCLTSLTLTAQQNGYVKPIVDLSHELHISEGRHPVIEAQNISEKFIPNDTLLNNSSDQMLIITGPNMAGKSTYIRQVALITIIAQIGSYIPAKYAKIGIVDKVFTRIGASDDLSRGQSTFMVEMTETANILNNATDRSLVILDEIGRGTSTYDGISIAWSVAEFLLTAENKKAKTLFATHYWELTKLEGKIPGAVNYNVAVGEYEDHIIFLRKIVKGGTDKSYGIHVARLAGMPQWVLNRAKEILAHLEENANRKSAFEPQKAKRAPITKRQPNPLQLSLFQ